MADNVTLNSMTGGSVVAADDIGSVYFQRFKLTIGADGVNDGDVSSANPLPVSLTLPNEGQQSMANSISVAIASDQSSLPVVLQTGSNAIGKLAANTGVDIGDVDVTSVTPGTAATSLGKAEDGAHTSGDVGVMLLGVGNVAQNSFAVDNDYMPIALDLKGNVMNIGNIAHDGIDAGNPVKVGMRAVDLGATPTAVAAADRADWLASRAGIPFVLPGHPNIVSQSMQVTDADGAQTDAAIITVGAGTAVVVTKVSVVADNANTTDVSVRIGFGTANTPAADAAQVLLFHPGIPRGGGLIEGDGSGIIGIGATNEDVRVTCEDPVGGSINIIVTYFTIAIG